MVAQRIAEERKKAGMSQLDLAEALNVSPSAIGNYEQGRRVPGIDVLIRMAKVFHTSIDFLVTGDDNLYNAIIKNTQKKELPKCFCPWYNTVIYIMEERIMRLETATLERAKEICIEKGISFDALSLPGRVKENLLDVTTPTPVEAVFAFCCTVGIELKDFFCSSLFCEENS